MMAQLTEFDLAQKRLKERQRMRTFLILWLAFLLGALFLMVIFPSGSGLWIILGLIAGVLAASNGLQLRISSPNRMPRPELVEQEMSWLFGEDWRDFTSAQEYAFAQDRIRQRRLGRFGLLLHLIVFVPSAAYLVLIGTFLRSYGEALGNAALIVPFAWLIGLLIPHAWRAFPTKGMLARREQKAGSELLLELRRMRPEKLKNDEKLKRGVQYTVGDDGELVEVSQLDEEKHKHQDT